MAQAARFAHAPCTAPRARSTHVPERLTFRLGTSPNGAMTQGDSVTLTASRAVFVAGSSPTVTPLSGFTSCTLSGAVDSSGRELVVTLDTPFGSGRVPCEVRGESTVVMEASSGLAAHGASGDVAFTVEVRVYAESSAHSH